MKYKKTVSSASENDQKDEVSPWSSNRPVYRLQISQPPLKLRGSKSDFREFIEHLTSTVSLVLVIITPLFLLSAALNSLSIFGLIIFIYTLSGTSGALLIRKLRKTTGTTSVIPKASDSHQAGIITEASGTNKKAA